MYPAFSIGSRAVALMGIRARHGSQFSERLLGSQLCQQTLRAFIIPFHAAISVANF